MIALAPAGGPQHGCAKSFAKRRPTTGQPVTTPMQGIAGQIQPQMGFIGIQPGTDTATATGIPGYRELWWQGLNKALGADAVITTNTRSVLKMDMQRRIIAHQRQPVLAGSQLFRCDIRGDPEGRQGQQHPFRQPRPQADPKCIRGTAGKCHMGTTGFCYRYAQ